MHFKHFKMTLYRIIPTSYKNKSGASETAKQDRTTWQQPISVQSTEASKVKRGLREILRSWGCCSFMSETDVVMGSSALDTGPTCIVLGMCVLLIHNFDQGGELLSQRNNVRAHFES